MTSELKETDCPMENDNMQESTQAIAGSQSQTVHQILALLSQGIGLKCQPTEGSSRKEGGTMNSDLSLPCTSSSSSAAGVDILDSHQGDTLTGEELFRLIMNDHHYLRLDGDSSWQANSFDSSLQAIPNAADIQKFFLETINLISFKPIKDLDPGSNQVTTQLQEIFESDISDRAQNSGNSSEKERKLRTVPENEESQQIDAMTKEEREKRKRDRQIWTSECRAVLGKVQENSLLSHAVDVLQKRWRSYLLTPTRVINKQAIRTARELNQTDDVMEMLEDTDRYVWQVIDEMAPRNLSMDL